MTDYQRRQRFMEDLAREAGRGIAKDRESPLSLDMKLEHELVTNADLNADALIRNSIESHYPGELIISEESNADFDSQALADSSAWIVDPIDGTVNFAHGHPQSAVSIAFAEGGRIVCGVVYNPFSDELFSAALGQGATCNGEAISPSSESKLRRSIIATGFPYHKETIEELVARLGIILANCADIRRLGSAALDICWVAIGRLDGYYESLSLWDFAAAQLIAREAGATYGHFKPLPEGASEHFHNEDILVANPALFPQLQLLLQDS